MSIWEERNREARPMKKGPRYNESGPSGLDVREVDSNVFRNGVDYRCPRSTISKLVVLASLIVLGKPRIPVIDGRARSSKLQAQFIRNPVVPSFWAFCSIMGPRPCSTRSVHLNDSCARTGSHGKPPITGSTRYEGCKSIIRQHYKRV